MRKRRIYDWHTGKLSKPVRLLVVSDLHNAGYADLMPLLSDADALLMPGDAADRYRQGFSRALRFIDKASRRLPTYVGVGNHEVRLKAYDDFLTGVGQTEAHFLFNTYERFGEMVIGCWYRPERFGHRDMLPTMQEEEGVKILMCHRPEDYVRRLRRAQVDLVLAGHAHGGQIRLGKQGLYAPGQGLFPKYTYGIVDQKMIISSGASNPVHMPRFGNPCEVLFINLD